MSNAECELPKGWRWVGLEEVLDLCDSGIWEEPPSEFSVYPVLRSNNIQKSKFIYDVDIAYRTITEEKVEWYRLRKGDILVVKSSGSREHIGKCALFQREDDTVFLFSNFTQRLRANTQKLLSEYLYYYLISNQARFELEKMHATSSGLRNIQIKLYKQQSLPLPPLPVQERIVQILQKADEIRRKRQEAVAIADAILPAIFIDMFGSPEQAVEQFGFAPLGEFAAIRSGVTKGRRLQNRETVEVPYLRVANVQDGYLDLKEIKTIEVLPEDIEKYHLENSDILMTEGGDPDKLGRGCLWQNEIDGCIHQNHVFRVRTNRSLLLPEFLAALLRTQYAKNYFLRCAKRTSNLASINSTQVKAFQIPTIPINLQNKFVSAVEQWNQSIKTLTTTYSDSEFLRQSLMQQAFTGELTSEWEAANTEHIAAKQALHDRLPQLVLLTFLKEKIKRTQHQTAEANVLVTALMKYAFLFQMEGIAKRRLYQFIPYHYGPFAKELYADLETLQEQGLITVDNGDEDKTQIAIANPEATERAIAALPDDFKEDVAAILDAYGDLDHNTLLETVYEKYPAYAKKSRLQKRRGVDLNDQDS